MLGSRPLAGYAGIVQCGGYSVYKQMADPIAAMLTDGVGVDLDAAVFEIEG